MTMADQNFPLYTKEHDGTIQKWYLFAWYGPRFSVSAAKNAKLHHYKRYYHMDDVGRTIFTSRKEALAALAPSKAYHQRLDENHGTDQER